MARVVVIGAGVMGLAAAYYALKAGHEVTVLEAAPEAGGMAAHFDLAGVSIERFYHFVCKADQPTFDLLAELHLEHAMRWVPTSMGYYCDGKLHAWGDPISLMKFPALSFLEKIRYGTMMLSATRRRRWSSLEQLSAREWISAWCGNSVYERLWAPLFRFKFHEHADRVSAAWLWARIKRAGTSRRSIFQEELGYIEGGSETLVHALARAIAQDRGTLRLATPAERVEVRQGAATGVIAAGCTYPAESVISTVPTPLVSRLVPDLAPDEHARYDAITSLGVVCVVLRLKRSASPHFWINISDSRFDIPGIVEFSNLRPTGDAVVYIPYYMPASHARFRSDDASSRDQAFALLKLVNPALGDGDLIASHVGRLRHAQPVCPPGFAATLPPVQTSIRGLQIADTCFYYPEDRSISESVRLGKAMAGVIR